MPCQVGDGRHCARCVKASHPPSGAVLEGQKKFDLVVRFNKNFRKDISDVDQLYVLTDNGIKIPLNQIADVSYKEGPAQLSHDNTKRRIFIGFNVVGRDVETVVKEIQSKLDAEYKLPSGYNITYGGQFQNLTEAKQRLSVAVPETTCHRQPSCLQ